MTPEEQARFVEKLSLAPSAKVVACAPHKVVALVPVTTHDGRQLLDLDLWSGVLKGGRTLDVVLSRDEVEKLVEKAQEWLRETA